LLLLWQLLSSSSAASPCGILHHSEWIGKNMRTRIQSNFWIDHLWELSTVALKFRIFINFDRRSAHERSLFLRLLVVPDASWRFGSLLAERYWRTSSMSWWMWRETTQVPANSLENVWKRSVLSIFVSTWKITVLEPTDPSLRLWKWVRLFLKDRTGFYVNRFVSPALQESKIEDDSLFNAIHLDILTYNPGATDCERSNGGQQCASVVVTLPADHSEVYLSLGIVQYSSTWLSPGNPRR
jgi:hypothetical protein